MLGTYTHLKIKMILTVFCMIHCSEGLTMTKFNQKYKTVFHGNHVKWDM